MGQRGPKANGRLIKSLRTEASWSQEHLAFQIGVDKSTVSRAERGSEVSHATLKRIADALKVSVKKLILREEEMPKHGCVHSAEFSITSFPSGYKPPVSERVFGCRMTYLEHACQGRDLVILLPGLGLDADSYRHYVTTARRHTIALTLPGFESPHPLCQETLCLHTYIHILIAWLHHLHETFPNKDLHVVGFSIGADMLLWVLQELCNSEQDLWIRSVLLLDCNIDQRTMTISRALAEVKVNAPVDCFKQVINDSRDDVELSHRINYVQTIMRKDLQRVRALAKEIVKRWPKCGTTVFWNSIGAISGFPGVVRLLFSSDNGLIITELLNSRPSLPLLNVTIDPHHCQHFDLVQPDILEHLIKSTLQKVKGSGKGRLKVRVSSTTTEE